MCEKKITFELGKTYLITWLDGTTTTVLFIGGNPPAYKVVEEKKTITLEGKIYKDIEPLD
jgi:hypothetical protein